MLVTHDNDVLSVVTQMSGRIPHAALFVLPLPNLEVVEGLFRHSALRWMLVVRPAIFILRVYGSHDQEPAAAWQKQPRRRPWCEGGRTRKKRAADRRDAGSVDPGRRTAEYGRRREHRSRCEIDITDILSTLHFMSYVDPASLPFFSHAPFRRPPSGIHASCIPSAARVRPPSHQGRAF